MTNHQRSFHEKQQMKSLHNKHENPLCKMRRLTYNKSLEVFTIPLKEDRFEMFHYLRNQKSLEIDLIKIHLITIEIEVQLWMKLFHQKE